jgi:hypothetical protein
MVLKNVFIAAICAIGLVLSGLCAADEYRPDELLRLDLSSAVLSPKPLGPAAGFAPGPLDVRMTRGSHAAQANTEPASENEAPLKAATAGRRIAHARVERSTHATRTALALHRRNPVDAEALDARIQVWPCKSGGICNWKRQR